jgi:hypothetical protein
MHTSTHRDSLHCYGANEDSKAEEQLHPKYCCSEPSKSAEVVLMSGEGGPQDLPPEDPKSKLSKGETKVRKSRCI